MDTTETTSKREAGIMSRAPTLNGGGKLDGALLIAPDCGVGGAALAHDFVQLGVERGLPLE